MIIRGILGIARTDGMREAPALGRELSFWSSFAAGAVAIGRLNAVAIGRLNAAGVTPRMTVGPQFEPFLQNTAPI